MKIYFLLVLFLAFFSISAYSQYNIIHEFEGRNVPLGMSPKGDLISDGSKFYGMTYDGGRYSGGVIFSIDFDGSNYSILHDFGNSTDGYQPYGSLILDGSTLYGMTSNGGINSAGTIFSINTSGENYTLLHEFAAGTDDGAYPLGSLLLSGSTLYGMTFMGGDDDLGTIFSISTSGSSFTLLHEFDGTVDGGAFPGGNLILSGSTLFGMTSYGGDSDYGVIFSISTSGSSFTLLHEFDGDNGLSPSGSLVLSGSTLYGMTPHGGVFDAGVIFSISTSGNLFTLLHEFDDENGFEPLGSLLLSGSTLYGMTSFGGIYDGGIIFQIESDGTSYNIIHEFDPFDLDDGTGPYGSLIEYNSTLYGMTIVGGELFIGAIFGLSIDENNFTLLHHFDYGEVGRNPSFTELVSDGNKLYGMTKEGGKFNLGTIFSINPDGTNFTILHNFCGCTDDGQYPEGSLILSGTTLYGMTSEGGNIDDNLDHGVIFSISTSGESFNILHRFTGLSDNGGRPLGSLTLSNTTLYGMTYNGGRPNLGVIFKIETNGNNFEILHEFAGGSLDGSRPIGNLLMYNSNLYGMTYSGGENNRGTIFKIDTDGSELILLYEFAGGTNDGAYPNGSLLLNGSTVYATTASGGSYGAFGTIFSFNLDDSDFSLLHKFAADESEGRMPYGNLTLSNNILYGLTTAGGASGKGTLFSLNTLGEDFAVLHSFEENENDGGTPSGSLLLAHKKLFGMTSLGGDYFAGTIFNYSLCQNTVYVDASYNDQTPGWGETHFSNLPLALDAICEDGTLHIANTSALLFEGDVVFDGLTVIIGDHDFELKGVITSGFVRATNNGKLIMRDLAPNTTKTFPITDGTYNYTMTVTTADVNNPDISVRISNLNPAGSINSDFWDIEGPINLNATVTLRVDKASIAPKTLGSNSQLRYRNSGDTRYVPVNGNNFSIEEFDTYYIITLTGVNEF